MIACTEVDGSWIMHQNYIITTPYSTVTAVQLQEHYVHVNGCGRGCSTSNWYGWTLQTQLCLSPSTT